jgi:hypothetical protein
MEAYEPIPSPCEPSPGGLGEESSFAKALAFLASDDSSFITGIEDAQVLCEMTSVYCSNLVAKSITSLVTEG